MHLSPQECGFFCAPMARSTSGDTEFSVFAPSKVHSCCLLLLSSLIIARSYAATAVGQNSLCHCCGKLRNLKSANLLLRWPEVFVAEGKDPYVDTAVEGGDTANGRVSRSRGQILLESIPSSFFSSTTKAWREECTYITYSRCRPFHRGLHPLQLRLCRLKRQNPNRQSVCERLGCTDYRPMQSLQACRCYPRQSQSPEINEHF